MNMHEVLVRIVQRVANSLTFNVLEIGAVPLSEDPEPFYSLIPSFQVHALMPLRWTRRYARGLIAKRSMGSYTTPLHWGEPKRNGRFT